MEWAVGSGAVNVGAVIPDEIVSRIWRHGIFKLSDWRTLGGSGKFERDTSGRWGVVSFAPCAASLDGDWRQWVALSVNRPEVGVERAFVDNVGTSESLDTGCGGGKGRHGCDVVHVD